MASPTAADADANAVGWRWDNTYARLSAPLFASAEPAGASKPSVAILNHRLAGELGLNFDALSPDETAALFSGQALPEGTQPIAQAYAGHQYGGFTMLGDGRALLLGEHVTPSGPRFDIQFKGSGRTRFSRGGDGLAVLGPMLREYVISEAMAALGIPTTRSLAVVTTGEMVFRNAPQKGAVLTRVAASHVRVGTFEYAARRDPVILKELADYAIERHFPEFADAPRKHQQFFREVAARQAALLARWQLAGFIHGVMNTDNMAISGETIDYGPCAFMNAYDPATVYSSIDRGGRYAYGNQPAIAQWNLARLAETLLPLFDDDTERAIAFATDVLKDFPARFEAFWLAGMRRKLGLTTDEEGDDALARSLLDWMQKTESDFTNTFRALSQDDPLTAVPHQNSEFQSWHARWLERLSRSGEPLDSSRALMRRVNPAVIPRNHRVEEALAAAEQRNDMSPLHRLLDALASPYEDRPEFAEYQKPPEDESGYRTFCGT